MPEATQRNVVVDGLIGLVALMSAAACVRGLMFGIPLHDPWLFPMLVVLPGVLAIVFGAILVLARPAVRANVLLLGIGMAVSLYVIEAALQVLPDRPPPTLAQVAEARGIAYDARDRVAVAAELRAAGTPAWIVVPANRLRAAAETGGLEVRGVDASGNVGERLVPLSNVADRYVVHCNESGQYSRFTTDRYGFNNPPGLWSGPVDVALVGDSFVHGACVDRAETLVAHVRAAFPATVGVGLDDFGPLSMLGLIREYVALHTPRDVFWFYYEWNDLRDLTRERESAALRAYLEADAVQGLAARQPAIDSAMADYIDRELMPKADSTAAAEAESRPGAAASRPRWRRPLRHAMLEWIKLYRLRGVLALEDPAERIRYCCDLDTFEAILIDARDTVAQWNGRLHFVYLPAALRYSRPLSRILDDEIRLRSRILDIASRLDLPVIDLAAALEATGDPAGLYVDFRSHFNTAGNRIAGEAIVRHLQSAEHATETPPGPAGTR